MKKLITFTSLFSVTATLFLAACAHDEPVTTSTTTTTRETAVRPAPSSTSTTTTRSGNY